MPYIKPSTCCTGLMSSDVLLMSTHNWRIRNWVVIGGLRKLTLMGIYRLPHSWVPF